MLDELSAEEFAEWQAFDAIEPIGGIADDYRAGMIALTVARSAGAKIDLAPIDWFPWNTIPADPAEDSLKIKAAMRKLADMSARNG